MKQFVKVLAKVIAIPCRLPLPACSPSISTSGPSFQGFTE